MTYRYVLIIMILSVMGVYDYCPAQVCFSLRHYTRLVIAFRNFVSVIVNACITFLTAGY